MYNAVVGCSRRRICKLIAPIGLRRSLPITGGMTSSNFPPIRRALLHWRCSIFLKALISNHWDTRRQNTCTCSLKQKNWPLLIATAMSQIQRLWMCQLTVLSKAYAEEQRGRIDPKKATPYFVAGLEKDGDTTYLCAADSEGNVVSLIQSLYHGFGSGIIGGDTGVLLHNRGSYFSLDPRHVNYLQPGKRTMHTLMPAMVLHDGVPYITMGSMGGDAQAQIQVQLLSAMIDFGMNAQQAITAPRWRSGPMRINPSGGRRDIIPGQWSVDEHFGRDIAELVMFEQRFPEEI